MTTDTSRLAGRRWLFLLPVLLLIGSSLASAGQKAVGSQDLWTALDRNDKEQVARLLAAGANIEERDRYGNTPLMSEMKGNSREMAELLLKSGADVRVRWDDGESTLHYAAMWGWTEIAELLITRGVDVNAANNDANTPLHVAASQGHLAITTLLLRNGANVNARTYEKGFGHEPDSAGDTPLHLVADSERSWRAIGQERQQYYRNKGAGAILETAALLLANGADVNAKNDKGQTPLRMATSKELKALLRKYGAK